jgi:hypothetical protein
MKSFQVLLVPALILTVTAPATPVLIHQYDFNVAGTVTDSVGGENGTLFSGASVAGGVLALDGVDDYVEFGASLVPTVGEFSIRFDARAVMDHDGRYKEIISQGSSGSALYIGYTPEYLVGFDPVFRFGDRVLIDHGGTGLPYPTDGQFHNFLFTTDLNETRFYIDNTLAWYLNTPPSLFFSTLGTNTRLGRQYGDLGEEFFHGDIDNVSIYSGTFDPDDVTPTVPEATSTLGFLVSSFAALVTLRRRPAAGRNVAGR